MNAFDFGYSVQLYCALHLYTIMLHTPDTYKQAVPTGFTFAF